MYVAAVFGNESFCIRSVGPSFWPQDGRNFLLAFCGARQRFRFPWVRRIYQHIYLPTHLVGFSRVAMCVDPIDDIAFGRQVG